MVDAAWIYHNRAPADSRMVIAAETELISQGIIYTPRQDETVYNTK
jgi:hypothetical protein